MMLEMNFNFRLCSNRVRISKEGLRLKHYSLISIKPVKIIKACPSSTLNEVVTDAISMNPTPTDKGRDLMYSIQLRLQLNHRHL